MKTIRIKYKNMESACEYMVSCIMCPVHPVDHRGIGCQAALDELVRAKGLTIILESEE